MGDAAAGVGGGMMDGESNPSLSSTNSKSESESKISSIFLSIVEHPDGSITRPTVPTVPPTGDNDNSDVCTKDIPLDPELNTSLRLYLPQINNNSKKKKKKLPVIVYCHGGGFVLFSPDFVLYHHFCHHLSLSLPSLVASLHYRLSPESRLPSAYDDAVQALLWLKDSTDPWIVDHADLSTCFLMGSSSGGNIAFFAGLRAVDMDLDPVKLRGLVLIQPYFGGEELTESEKESEDDEVLPLCANLMMWRMALPQGTNRDHEYCNPAKMMDAAEDKDEKKKLVLPRTMVLGVKGDPLFDRQKRFVEMLLDKAQGVSLVAKMEEHEKASHAIELFDPAKAQAMFADIREFVNADCF